MFYERASLKFSNNGVLHCSFYRVNCILSSIKFNFGGYQSAYNTSGPEFGNVSWESNKYNTIIMNSSTV